ncbi:MAG: DivIVA domain-containing protein [Desulfobacteraceae bacterium]|nr:DivIVA domain-containing protein [Desulfobacteraceae bacterium]
MSLTPEDIQSKQFHVRFRGFDVEEVDGFLEQIAEGFLLLQEENRNLKERLDSMTQDLDTFKQDEVSFKNAILSAQKVADEMKKKSRQDASRMLQQAKNEVSLLRDDANREIAALEARVDQLRGMQGKLMTDLRAVLSGYLEQLDDPALSVPPSHPRVMEPPVSQRPAPSPRPEAEAPLYEKIAVEEEGAWLGEEDDLSSEENAGPGVAGGPSVNGLDLEEEGPSVTIPALDDEVMFTLDDPLDKEAGRRRR